MALEHLKLPIEGGQFYHIYKKSSIPGPLFFTPTNYQFFLRKMDGIIGDMVDMMAFCLLPDHFHLLFRAREVIMIKEEYVDHPVEIGHFISESLRKIFAVYSANITKQEGFVDPILDNNFSRVILSDDESIRQLIRYIHFNPQLHAQTDTFQSYPYSSYPILSGKSKTMVDRDTVFSLFGDQASFINAHEQINIADFPSALLIE